MNLECDPSTRTSPLVLTMVAVLNATDRPSFVHVPWILRHRSLRCVCARADARAPRRFRPDSLADGGRFHEVRIQAYADTRRIARQLARPQERLQDNRHRRHRIDEGGRHPTVQCTMPIRHLHHGRHGEQIQPDCKGTRMRASHTFSATTISQVTRPDARSTSATCKSGTTAFSNPLLATVACRAWRMTPTSSALPAPSSSAGNVSDTIFSAHCRRT